MWAAVAAILILVWLACLFLLHVTSFLVHLLLGLAVMAMVCHFLRAGRTPS
jgi:hypothetical protein